MPSPVHVPYPSSRSSLPASSPIHLSTSSSNSWKHIISVAQAFSDRLSQLPQDTPVATNRHWRQRCRDKGIDRPSAPTVEEEEAATEEARSSPIVTAGASVSSDSTNSARPIRRRGRPRKSLPPAIVAAKKNLRKISEISDRQWEQSTSEPEVADETSTGTPRQDEDAPRPRRPTRSTRRRRNIADSSSNDKTVGQSNSLASTNDEPTPETVEDVETSPEVPSKPQKFRKQPAPMHHKSSTLFYFTTLPKPTPAHMVNQNRILSHRTKLPSDKVVMLCMRAKVRRQKRMRSSGVAQTDLQLPQGSWLKRNFRVMEKRMERLNRKSGKNADREAAVETLTAEDSQQQPSNDNNEDISRERIDIEEGDKSVPGRDTKRRRISK